jgi:hypothetical protein
VSDLVKTIEGILDSPNHKYKRPFERSISPLGQQSVLERFRDITLREFSESLLAARQEVWLAGISLEELANPRNTRFFYKTEAQGDLIEGANIRELIGALIVFGVDANVLIMHEENPALGEMLHLRPGSRADPLEILDGVRREITYSAALWQRTASQVYDQIDQGLLRARENVGTFRLVKVRRGIIYQRATLTERHVITTPFSYTYAANGSIPAIAEPAGTAWHTFVRQELAFLAQVNAPTTWARERKRGVIEAAK